MYGKSELKIIYSVKYIRCPTWSRIQIFARSPNNNADQRNCQQNNSVLCETSWENGKFRKCTLIPSVYNQLHSEIWNSYFTVVWVFMGNHFQHFVRCHHNTKFFCGKYRYNICIVWENPGSAYTEIPWISYTINSSRFLFLIQKLFVLMSTNKLSSWRVLLEKFMNILYKKILSCLFEMYAFPINYSYLRTTVRL